MKNILTETNEDSIKFNRILINLSPQCILMEVRNCKIAYFSMEIGIDERIPTFSGGLGVLAGDTLRSAADLQVPMVGITLLYRKGFFKQKIINNQQQESAVIWKPEQFLTLLPEKVTVQIENRDIQMQAWQYVYKGVRNHSIPVLFLDTDIPGNSEYDRTLTDKLYGGDQYYRLCQEIILGVGGTRLLATLGCSPEKYHMNEGHSALLALELCKRFGDIEEVRQHCVFTTHTPVAAGHDAFPKEMAERALGELAQGVLCEELYHENTLNMTYVGLRYSHYINGVAKRHGEVSREMFPGYRIESITNGIHTGYWISSPMAKLFDEHIRGWRADPFSLRYVLSIAPEKIWDAHMESKRDIISFVNGKYGTEMDPHVFTIGFARRATAYKRADLLFLDVERLKAIAAKHPVQLIFAGKAHPNDTQGKEIIRKINELLPTLPIKACYIEDYDITVAKKLIAGVDLWLNTPQRPREASGTSGMKAAANGVPHFSTLDGWWLEGHIEGTTGWSIGVHPKENAACDNAADAQDLYAKMEYEILPRFYEHRDEWINTMRHTIAINGSFFNTHRMVQQYVMNAYF